MKILYLTARQPYPFIKGDQIIAYNQIKELSKEHNVYLFSFYEGDKREFMEEMGKYCKCIYAFKNNSLKKIFAMMKTVFKPTSIQSNCFFRYSMLRELNKIIDLVKPDIIHVQSFRMAEYLYRRDIRKSIGLIDAYSLNMKKRADRSSGVLKFLWKLEYHLLARYEKRILKDYKVKTIVAERDKRYLKDKAITTNPVGVSMNKEVIEFARAKRKDDHFNIIFQGNMSYYPNVEATKILKNRILPKISKEYGVKTYIVGGNPCKDVIQMENEDIKVTGYVKNIEDYLGISDLAVYPIISATGIQNKVLEAMDGGVPTVISEECAKGIPGIKDGVNTFIAREEEDYIKIIESILNDANKGEIVRDNALEFVKENYSWKKNVDTLLRSWEML